MSQDGEPITTAHDNSEVPTPTDTSRYSSQPIPTMRQLKTPTTTIRNPINGQRLSSTNKTISSPQYIADGCRRIQGTTYSTGGQYSPGGGTYYSPVAGVGTCGVSTKHHSSPSWCSPHMTSGGTVNYNSSGYHTSYGSAVTSSGGTYLMAGQAGTVGTSRIQMRGDEMSTRVLSERFVEHEVRVPKRLVVEEIVEKMVIIPEKIVHEELVEESMKVRERIIEIAKTIYQEKIVEVPEYEYVERIVEVPEYIIQEKIKEVARIEIQERIVEIPKLIVQEKIVEVPEIEYREIQIEKIVEIPEIREEVVYRQVQVPQYIEKPIPEYVNVEIDQEIPRSIPVPVESITTVTFTLPKIRSKYIKVDLPIYVPRFIEIALPIDMADQAMLQQAETYSAQLQSISNTSASLCDVENLAYSIKSTDWSSMVTRHADNKMMQQLWESGKLQVDFSAFGTVETTTKTEIRHQTIDFDEKPIVELQGHMKVRGPLDLGAELAKTEGVDDESGGVSREIEESGGVSREVVASDEDDDAMDK